MTRLLTVVAATSVLTAALAPAAPIPEDAKAVPLYWPTAVGTRLVYLRGEQQPQQEETWEVTSVVDRDGGKLVTTEYVRANDTRSPHQTALVTVTGVSLLKDNGTGYDPPWRVLTFPHKRGDSWGIPARGQVERMSVVGAETVTVPAGRFETVVVEWQRGPNEQLPRYAYALGVGLVRLTYPGGSMVLKSVTHPRR
jgi:hypothetical protein